MKLKLSIAAFLILIISVNAQIYTPLGIIQGTSGNNFVGIGTDLPLYKLNVQGGHSDARVLLHSVGGGDDARQADLMLWASEPEISWTGVGIGNNVSVSSNKGLHLLNIIRGGSYMRLLDSSISFGVVSSASIIKEALYIDTNGNIGAGTATPTAKLEVVSSFNTNQNEITSFFARQATGTGGSSIVRFGYHSTSDFEVNSGYSLSGHRFGSYFDLNIVNNHAGGDHGGINFATNSSVKMAINVNGNVGIGMTNPKNKLDVKGTIHSQEVKVDMLNWSDFVFKKEYNLPTLEQVEKHIAEKGHLENIPNEKEVLENGINLGEMNAKLLQKIEELTLYIIELKRENDLSKEKQIDLEKRIKKIENK